MPGWTCAFAMLFVPYTPRHQDGATENRASADQAEAWHCFEKFQCPTQNEHNQNRTFLKAFSVGYKHIFGWTAAKRARPYKCESPSDKVPSIVG